MSVRSRFAFASGVAGLAGAVAVLTGRTDANVGLLLILALAPIAGAAGVALDGRATGGAALLRQIRLAPAWALVAGAAAIRAGSASFADVRGANAVAGIPLARGPAVSVAGAWLALIGGVVALAGIAARSDRDDGRAPLLRLLEAGGVIALGVFLAGMFAGPQVRGATDAIWWIGAVLVVGAAAWRARDLALPDLWIAATVLAGAGLVMSIAGGAP